MQGKKADNTLLLTRNYARIFNPKLVAEIRRSFLACINHMHDAEGLTWPQIAEVIGIGLTTLQGIRTGDRNISLPMIYFLVDHLSLSIGEFIALGEE